MVEMEAEAEAGRVEAETEAEAEVEVERSHAHRRRAGHCDGLLKSVARADPPVRCAVGAVGQSVGQSVGRSVGRSDGRSVGRSVLSQQLDGRLVVRMRGEALSSISETLTCPTVRSRSGTRRWSREGQCECPPDCLD